MNHFPPPTEEEIARAVRTIKAVAKVFGKELTEVQARALYDEARARFEKRQDPAA